MDVSFASYANRFLGDPFDKLELMAFLPSLGCAVFLFQVNVPLSGRPLFSIIQDAVKDALLDAC